MSDAIASRLEAALRIAEEAGALGTRYFRALDSLTIESKGHQDLVSDADREVELLVRARLAESFPDDAIVGEEHAPKPGTSGFTWVIDPIDGTANFVRGIPAWCVAIACTDAAGTVLGVTFEPSSGETFWASRGGGAFVNGRPMRASLSRSLGDGSVAVGYSNRTEAKRALALMAELTGEGGIFFRNASGALMLAYVAAGRLIGYVEEHMNSWDCLGGLLMIEEAGGHVRPLDPATMVAKGGMIVAGGPDIFARIERLADNAFG